MAEQAQPDDADARRISVTVDGNRLEALETGADRLKAILDLIDNAKDSLRVIFYIFAGDEAGTAVRDALVRAARRGVVVRLLLDGYGSSGTDTKFFQPIADEGGAFCMFLPSYGRRYLIRNHQKLVIADERRTIIGGANVETGYLTDEGEESLARPVGADRRIGRIPGKPLLRFAVPVDADQRREAANAAADRRALQPVRRSAAMEVQWPAQPAEPITGGACPRAWLGPRARPHRRLFLAALVLPPPAPPDRADGQGAGHHGGEVGQ